MTIINDIILEGFKSYATKTIFSNLNSRFNSITGTNGSGKSNILDGICFVLGLANLAIIRAGTLDDLIYKNEKTKNEYASVSLILKDKNFSRKLFGFKNIEKISITRKIMVGGKNKYFLNGEVVNPGKILNFLYSINININNPHFFIRQGHITRIAKMNSTELLQTVESAFGIKLYTTKKKNALALIEKKNDKVEEINFILINQIRPLLNKIGHSDFSYKKLEFLKSKNRRWATNISINNIIERNASESLEKKLEKRIFKKKISIKCNKKLCDRLFPKIFNYIEILDCLNLFLGKNIIGFFSDKFARIRLNDKVSKIFLLKILENYKNQRNFIKRYKKIKSKKEKIFLFHHIDDILEDCKNKKLIYGKFWRKKKKINNYMEIISSYSIFLNHFFLKLKLNTNFKKKNFFQYLIILREDYLNKKIFFLKKIAKNFVGNKNENYKIYIKTWKEMIKKIYVKIERFFGNEKKNFWELRFAIFGSLASLIQIKNSFLTTALEFASPSRVKMIILDTNFNSKKILEQSNLKKKISIIPLSEIPVSDKAYEKMITNLSLINYVGYKKHVSKSISFVFENIYLTLDVKNSTNFREFFETKIKKITPNGDIFESQGSVITGKNIENGFSFLAIFSEFNNQKIYFSRTEIISRKQFIKKRNSYFNFFEKSKFCNKKWKKFLKKFSIQVSFIQNLNRKKKKNFFLEKLICFEKFYSNHIFFTKEKKKKIPEKFLNFRIKNLNKINNSLHEVTFQFKLNFEFLTTDIFSIKKIFYRIFCFCKKFFFLSELKKFIFYILPLKILFVKKKLKLNLENFFFGICNNFSQQNMKFHKNLKKSQVKKKVGFYFKNIKEERKFIIGKIFSILAELKSKNPSKFLDKKILNFLLEGAVQYRELIRKRVMIEKDRLIIEHIIKQLDIKKNKIVVKSIRKVNIAFQAMFSMLLPGSLGKLVLIRSLDKALQGIDFRIKSGETHSETLDELSGGQKSIIALSFIFSLLLSKPAPFYILDEIDAALDLCHTQNIGKIIREYFPMSQFLVVSLKNGIITNANIIFKIKNIRGKSNVTRIVNNNCENKL